MQLDRGDEARGDLEQLLELMPQSSEVRVRLGTILDQAGDFEGAKARFAEAAELGLEPEERPRIHYGLASLLRRSGDFDEAVDHYRTVLETAPEFLPAVADLASLLAQLSRMREAAVHYGTWVAIEPGNLAPRMAEASALILSHQHAAAGSRLEAALERFPDNVQVQDVLARHLAACPDRGVRDGERALELATAVFEKVPTLESAETVAMAYAEAGRHQEAASWQRELIAKLEAEGDPQAVEQVGRRLRANLAVYENGKACCAQ